MIRPAKLHHPPSGMQRRGKHVPSMPSRAVLMAPARLTSIRPPAARNPRSASAASRTLAAL